MTECTQTYPLQTVEEDTLMWAGVEACEPVCWDPPGLLQRSRMDATGWDGKASLKSLTLRLVYCWRSLWTNHIAGGWSERWLANLGSAALWSLAWEDLHNTIDTRPCTHKPWLCSAMVTCLRGSTQHNRYQTMHSQTLALQCYGHLPERIYTTQ